MHRIFILDDVILNTSFAPRIEKLRACGAWEMPEHDVQAVFGDKAGMACNAYCTFTKTDNGYAVTFTPPKVDMEEVRDKKKKEAEQALTAKIAEITPYYPTDEKVSFAKQEEEALKYQANPEIDESEIPCIAGIAKGRQITLDLLVQKILAKAALFSKMSGYYMGLKQRIEDLADEAQTIEEIEAIDVTAIFSEIPN